jgi:hypothetical protein
MENCKKLIQLTLRIMKTKWFVLVQIKGVKVYDDDDK